MQSNHNYIHFLLQQWIAISIIHFTYKSLFYNSDSMRFFFNQAIHKSNYFKVYEQLFALSITTSLRNICIHIKPETEKK